MLGDLVGRSLLQEQTNGCLSESVIFAYFTKFLKAASAAVSTVDAADLYIVFACFKAFLKA